MKRRRQVQLSVTANVLVGAMRTVEVYHRGIFERLKNALDEVSFDHSKRTAQNGCKSTTKWMNINRALSDLSSSPDLLAPKSESASCHRSFTDTLE